MRNSRPGRGERARVAYRVRAILADAREVVADDSGADRPDDAPPGLPWLPSEDFAGRVRSGARPRALPAPEASEAPSEAPEASGTSEVPEAPEWRSAGAAHRAAGLIERLMRRLPVRVDPGRRGAIAVGAAVLVAAVLTGTWVLSSHPHAVAVTADPVEVAAASPAAPSAVSPTPDPTSEPSSAPPGSAAPVLVVDVAGKVRHPGLYNLPSGSRVDDAVQAAGGALRAADLTALNLAAKISDGQQVAVGLPGGGAPGAAGSGGGTDATGSAVAVAPVDLNSATLDQLETLPGVGPVLGQHIVDWRTAHGQFTTIDQLQEVSGIGDVKFAALRSKVTV